MADHNKKHTISVLVENRPRVLARTAALFSRRGFNIDSLAVSTTENPDISRMTIVVQGSDAVLEQITKQLNKVVDVIKVLDHTGEPLITRELALVKVNAEAKHRAEIMQIVSIFRGNIVDIAANLQPSTEPLDALTLDEAAATLGRQFDAAQGGFGGAPKFPTPGLIDAGYRDELRVLLVNLDPTDPFEVQRGDRIAQLVIQRVEHADFVVVEELPASERGLGGAGRRGPTALG